MPVESHTGDCRAFTRRYDRQASAAVAQGLSGIAELGPKLLNWIADARNLRAAWDYLRRYGGAAPGPNGLRYEDLTNSEVWELMRVLGQAIRHETYRPGPDRAVRIKKTSGRGYRTLRLQNIEDRVVARAIVQIIQPLLDWRFDERSFGYRPGRDRCHALATALHITQYEDRTTWLLEDVKDAYDQVPLQRLLDIVRKYLPSAEGCWTLIEHTLTNGTKRGLRQGAPLSPLLMNVYLDRVLDKVWRKKQPGTPLLRSADDLLVLCRTQKEALQARKLLRQILSLAGMPLKETIDAIAIRNLHTGNKADWLGFGISMGDGSFEVHIAAATWNTLAEKLSLAHDAPAAPLRAIRIVEGVIKQLGPCYPHEDRNQVATRIADTAGQLAFDELPGAEELLERWHAAYRRWRRLQHNAFPASLTSAPLPDYTDSDDDGSADRHVFCAAQRRSDGALNSAPSLSFSTTEMVTLYTDGSCCRLTRQGGWAAIFVAPSLPHPVRGSGTLHRTTNNRAELMAVINGLERLAGPTRLRIVSDSAYVVGGIDAWLPKWKAQGWRAGSGRHKRALRNEDLWRQLDALLMPHTVICKWVRGHSGHFWNEECDRMARRAAKG